MEENYTGQAGVNYTEQAEVKISKKVIIANLQREIEELNKRIKSLEDNKNYYDRRATEAESQINQIHDLLDAIPSTIPKRDPDSYTDRKVITRLAAWLAVRGA